MSTFHHICEAHKPERNPLQWWIKIENEPKPYPGVCDQCEARAEWVVIDYEQHEDAA